MGESAPVSLLEEDMIFTHFINGTTQVLRLDNDTTPNKEDLFPVISPATNKPVFYFAPSSSTDVATAIDTAQRVFETQQWSDSSFTAQRATILTNIARLLRQNTDRLADLEVSQIGRPRKEMRFQLGRLPEWFEYFAALLRVREDTIPPFGPGYLNTVHRVPLGVVAQITPFNHPLLITVKKLAPALAAGNTVVLKPSELAPASILELAKLCTQAGLPDGVLSVILGGKDVSQQLIADSRIAKVDFTGGPVTGRSIGQTAGGNLCAVTQELGGKAPMIVCGPPHSDRLTTEQLDAYLDPFVNGCAFGAFIASGQTCIAGTRILVEQSIYEVFKQKLVAKASSVFRLGDPMDMETTIGPVITKKHMEWIHETLHAAVGPKNDGAKGSAVLEILCGGKQYTSFTGSEAHLNDGNYYEPTVVGVKSTLLEATADSGTDALLDLHHANTIFQKELFGPVVGLIPFRTEDHAIELANDTSFSLGCSIWTHDIVQAHKMANAVNAGIVWINDHHKNHPSSPWGGLTKESGIGRENGLDAYNEYTQSKSIVINLNRFAGDWFKDLNARYN